MVEIFTTVLMAQSGENKIHLSFLQYLRYRIWIAAWRRVAAACRAQLISFRFICSFTQLCYIPKCISPSFYLMPAMQSSSNQVLCGSFFIKQNVWAGCVALEGWASLYHVFQLMLSRGGPSFFDMAIDAFKGWASLYYVLQLMVLRVGSYF